VIVVRNVFRLKFGKSKEAVTLWKEGMAQARQMGFAASSLRLLTDLSGPFYTLVFENTFESLAAYERSAKELMANPQWRAWYEKTMPLTESGYREIFNVVE
jgi:hypothetical protein